MSELQIFSNPEFGGIRTVEQDGEPWFVGKDVAVALGYSNTKDAVSSHVDEEDKQLIQKSENTTFEIPNRGLMLINESGLYSLVLSSKLPNAKKFKHWVTSEVLPAIRKSGSYMMQGMSKELQSIFLLDQRTMKHEERISALENTMTVDSGKQQVLQQTVNSVVVQALGGKESSAYNDHHVRGKTYSELHRDLKSWFKVASYRDVPKKRFDEAVEYIQRWKPSTNTVMLIQQTNNQTCLFNQKVTAGRLVDKDGDGL